MIIKTEFKEEKIYIQIATSESVQKKIQVS